MADTELESDGRRAFDFLHGTWNVHNRRLARRLEQCRDWHEFDASVVVRPILHGLGNIDSFCTEEMPCWGMYEGLALRLFDPDTRLWKIWWAATSHPGRLDEPLVGRFTGAHGRFHCHDDFNGRPIQIRFDWFHSSAASARWEQAFSGDDGHTWETNWVMTLSRQETR